MIFSVLILSSVYCVLLSAESPAGLKNISKSTCSINRGTGVVFSEDETHFWIMTAGHCVVDSFGGIEKTEVEFYHTGRRSHKIVGEVLLATYDQGTVNDIAIVKIKKEDLLNYPSPTIIPLAKRDAKVDEKITSYGCPNSNWPSGWTGRIVSVGKDYIIFYPKPIQGRSGSGIFDEDGQAILGIIIWTDGTAVSAKQIHKLINKE